MGTSQARHGAQHKSQSGQPPTIRQFVRSGITAVTNAAGGRRIKASMDRRIRSEIARQLPRQVETRVRTRQELAVDAVLDRLEHTDWLTGLVRSEVQLALAAQQPSRAEVSRRAARNFTADTYFAAASSSSRLLDPTRYRRLGEQIRQLTGASSVDWAMQQAFRTLVDHESRGLGRIAGTTDNIIGKLVAPTLLQAPAGPVLEIGTLYGLFSPALVRQFRRQGEFRSLTVIDPLEGVQIQPGTSGPADPTGTPVVAEVARWNIGECGVDDVTMIQGYSTDPDVRALVEREKYAVVVIDGDHSEAGVYADLWWVEQLVLDRAVVVMDDFGDVRWPGVEAATRRYLADGGRLELLGTASSSAYLRMPDA